ncbi:MAG TPA: hypothetical protein VG013_24095 [Gemmataceae bacterium]|jgi:hypothetical protein|nr:hypothetical protein [Gemmataceae bacterium]
MAIPLTPNEQVTVYRGVTAANPYPRDGARPVLANVPCYVKQHMKNGRFGNTAANVHWTHKLFINLNDIRDAYNAELGPGPAEVVANADTILINDYVTVGTCCAFMVVAVVHKRRAGDDYLIAYLDRFQPNYGNPCPKLPQQVQGTINTPCCPNLLPATLHFTITATTCIALQGVVGNDYVMTYNSTYSGWTVCLFGTTFCFNFHCGGGNTFANLGVLFYCLGLGGLQNTSQTTPAGGCLPVDLSTTLTILDPNQGCCLTGDTISIHVTV